MTGIYLLKNVYNFAQILNLAASENIEKWDKTMLQRAVSWAKYCEEVYKHVHQQGCEEAMNKKIIQLTTLVSPSSLLTLTFDCLMKATHLLLEIILKNPKRTADLFEHLQSMVDVSVLTEVRNIVKTKPAICDELDEIFYVYWIQNGNALKFSKDNSIFTYAQIFQSIVLKVMDNSENQERFQHYCESLCDQLATVKNGWDVLVHVFSSCDENRSTEYDPKDEVILKIVLYWMNNKTKDIVKCPVLQIDKTALREASLNSPGFLTFYLSALEKWSQSFQPNVDNVCENIWRDCEGDGTSVLVDHFHFLLALSDSSRHKPTEKHQLRQDVLSFLSDTVKSSDFSVWRSVVKCLLIT